MTTLAEIKRHVGVPADGKWGPRTASAVDKALGMNGKPRIMADHGAFFPALRKITGPLNQVQVDSVNGMLARDEPWPPSQRTEERLVEKAWASKCRYQVRKE